MEPGMRERTYRRFGENRRQLRIIARDLHHSAVLIDEQDEPRAHPPVAPGSVRIRHEYPFDRRRAHRQATDGKISALVDIA